VVFAAAGNSGCLAPATIAIAFVAPLFYLFLARRRPRRTFCSGLPDGLIAVAAIAWFSGWRLASRWACPRALWRKRLLGVDRPLVHLSKGTRGRIFVTYLLSGRWLLLSEWPGRPLLILVPCSPRRESHREFIDGIGGDGDRESGSGFHFDVLD